MSGVIPHTSPSLGARDGDLISQKVECPPWMHQNLAVKQEIYRESHSRIDHFLSFLRYIHLISFLLLTFFTLVSEISSATRW